MEYKTIKEEMYDEIYQKYHDDVYRISLYYTKDEHTAQDIAQNVFFKFYLHFERVKKECVKAYLLRCARNLSYNWLRDMKHEYRGEYIDNIPEEHLVLHSAEDKYIMKERRQTIKEFLAKILEELREENEDWYDIIHMIYCLERPHPKVAIELDISMDVLYSRLYRAKRWIRKKFEEEYKLM